jgi:hypothetical protein
MSMCVSHISAARVYIFSSQSTGNLINHTFEWKKYGLVSFNCLGFPQKHESFDILAWQKRRERLYQAPKSLNSISILWKSVNTQGTLGQTEQGTIKFLAFPTWSTTPFSTFVPKIQQFKNNENIKNIYVYVSPLTNWAINHFLRFLRQGFGILVNCH